MRVTIDTPLVVANTSSFGETYVVASGGVGATGLDARFGMTISDGDFNPERIQLEDGILSPGYDPDHTQGDRLASVTGIMTYGFNSPELLVTGGVTVLSDVTIAFEATTLRADRDHLTVASYNVEISALPTSSRCRKSRTPTARAMAPTCRASRPRRG